MSEKLNLDVLVSSTIHSHNYIRIDGVEASNSKYVSNVEREKGVYSSPRNIRKLYIKNTGIDIVYYRPVVGRGDSLCETIKFSEKNKNLIQSAYRCYEKRMLGAGDLADDVMVIGSGFGAFLNDLSLNNLEELYFDWSLLLGNKQLFRDYYIKNRSLKDYSISGLKVITYEFYTSLAEVKKMQKKIIQAEPVTSISNSLVVELLDYVTSQMCGNRPGGLAASYPRLKYIGFIGNSEKVLKSNGGINKKNIFEYDFDAIYNCKFSSLGELKRDLCAGDKFSFSVFADTGADLLSAGFRVDSSLYQFDKQFLESYLKSLENNRDLTREEELNRYFFEDGDTKLGLESKLAYVKKFRAGELQRQKAALKNFETMKSDNSLDDLKSEKLDSKPRTEIEKALTHIYKTEGEKSVLITLKCLEMQYTKEHLLEEIEQFSPAGKIYYKSLLDKN